MTWAPIICLLLAISASCAATVITAIRSHQLVRSVKPCGVEATGGGPLDGEKIWGRGMPTPGVRVPIVWLPQRIVPGVGVELAGDPHIVGVYVCQHRGRWWRRRVVFVWQPGAPQDMSIELVGGGDAG